MPYYVCLALLIGFGFLSSNETFSAYSTVPSGDLPTEKPFRLSVHDSVAKQLDAANQRWLTQYNQQGDVGASYLPDAVFFPEQATAIRGNQSIGAYYTQQYAKIAGIQSVKALNRFAETPDLVYEIGQWDTQQGGSYA